MGRWPPNYELVEDFVPGLPAERVFRIHLDTPLDAAQADQVRSYLEARDADGLKSLLIGIAASQGRDDPSSLALINAINFATGAQPQA